MSHFRWLPTVSTVAVASTDASTLQGFVEARTEPTAQVYTDEAAAYRGLNRPHEAVKHSAREYVHGMAHTNGIESHWAMLKRGYVGVYHQMSVKHLPRYVAEFEGRHNTQIPHLDKRKTSLAPATKRAKMFLDQEKRSPTRCS